MPGEEGVWFFIFGDMLFFAAFFVTFIYYRAQSPELYDSSQLGLKQIFGLVNTILLLASSWFVAQSLQVFRAGRLALARRLLAGAICLGTGFIVSKAFEWGDKFAHGITIETNEFFMFYFMFTGIHLLHVVIGIGLLVYMHRLAGRARTDDSVVTMESGAAFWHLVDLLWVVLFALLYLMR